LDTNTLKDVFDEPVKTEEVKLEVKMEGGKMKNAKMGIAEGTTGEMMDSMTETIERATDGKAWSKLMNLLMQLRKVCDQYNPLPLFSNRSPYMLPNSEPEPFLPGEHIVLASGKYILLDKLLPKLFKEGHRVLLFSGFTSYLPVSRTSVG
jgi:SWI/SNF-related matrix-associated actin-dependent regulator of chromatin subfamily A member 5